MSEYSWNKKNVTLTWHFTIPLKPFLQNICLLFDLSYHKHEPLITIVHMATFFKKY